MMNPTDNKPRPAGSGPSNKDLETFSGQREINSFELFGDQNEIVIKHQGDYYRLRITSNHKLILTK